MKFRKKPVVIEAEHVTTIIGRCGTDWSGLPLWVKKAYDEGKLVICPNEIFVETLEGNMRAGLSDMLIQGVNGEIYPCKPDIFAKTYEAA